MWVCLSFLRNEQKGGLLGTSPTFPHLWKRDTITISSSQKSGCSTLRTHWRKKQKKSLPPYQHTLFALPQKHWLQKARDVHTTPFKVCASPFLKTDEWFELRHPPYFRFTPHLRFQVDERRFERVGLTVFLYTKPYPPHRSISNRSIQSIQSI